MAYVKTQGGQTVYPYSIGQLRKDNPNTSFPKSIPDEMLAAYGVHSVTVLNAPVYDEATQRIEQDAQPTERDGQWAIRWTVTDLSAEELAAKSNEKAAGVRMQRDRLLAACDWTQVADAPVDQAAWATYRQALRDITAQAGFPDNVTWPTKPE
jgi:hypothetical protein